MFRTGRRRNPKTGRPYPWIVQRSAMVNNYYIYAVDRDFGPLSGRRHERGEADDLRSRTCEGRRRISRERVKGRPGTRICRSDFMVHCPTYAKSSGTVFFFLGGRRKRIRGMMLNPGPNQ